MVRRVSQDSSGRWLSDLIRSPSPGKRALLTTFSVGLILSAIGSALAWRSYEDRAEREEEQVLEAAVESARASGQFFADRIAVLDTLAQMTSVRLGSVEEMLPMLEAVSGEELGFSGGVGWIDAEGVLRVESGVPDDALPIDLSDRRYVQEVLATGRHFVSEAIRGRISGASLIVLAVPSFRGDELTGMVTASMPVDRLGTEIPLIAPRRFQTRVVDRSGSIILIDGRAGSMSPPENPALLEVLEPSISVGTGLLGDPRRVVGVSQVPLTGWSIVVEQDQRTLLAGARGRFIGELVVLGALAMIAIFVALMAARRLDVSHREILRRARDLGAMETLSESLSSAPGAKEVAASAIAVFRENFETALVRIGLMEREGVMTAYIQAADGSTEDPEGVEDALAHGAPSILRDAHASGGLLIVDGPTIRETYPYALDPGVTGAMASGFRGRDVSGVVALFLRDDAYPPTGHDIELFEAMVPLLGDAFGRAMATERERMASRTFQMALLPRDTIEPQVNLQRAVRYRPASGDVEVGGDWYDLWMVDSTHVGVVVGDVVGRGVEAAAAMGQLRSALRATTAAAPSAGEALSQLDDLTDQIPGSPSATILLGTVDLAREVITLASAGHLPPVLVAGGQVRVMHEVKGTPIGFVSRSVGRTSVAAKLHPGDTVVFYSDGLIERRGETIDHGIARLVAALTKSSDLAIEALAEAVLRDCMEPDHQDDVALLCLRLVEDVPRTFTQVASMDALEELVEGLGRWLKAIEWQGAPAVLEEVEAALAVVTGVVGEEAAGEMMLEVDMVEDGRRNLTLEYRRPLFGADVTRVDNRILRGWGRGVVAEGGPRLTMPLA
jgi:serine phosphatase RsbU (regulator of sigma subunit)